MINNSRGQSVDQQANLPDPLTQIDFETPVSNQNEETDTFFKLKQNKVLIR